MIYPVKGRKQLPVYNAIAGVVMLGFAALVIVAALISGHTVLGLVMAVVLVPSYLYLFVVGMPQRDLRHWQYEIQGDDLLFKVRRINTSVPISQIVKVAPTEGSKRVWWGDMLQVTYVSGTPLMPTLLNPEDKDALLRGLAEADPGLTYDGRQVSRTG